MQHFHFIFDHYAFRLWPLVFTHSTPVPSDPFYFLDFSCLLIMMKLRKERAVRQCGTVLMFLPFLFTSYLPGRGELCLGTFGRFLNQFLFSVPESGLYFLWLGILKLNSQKLLCSPFCLSVFLLWKWNPSPAPFLPLFLVIGSSFPLSQLSLSSVSLNKAANGAWKWWQHSHAYRQTLSLLCVAVCKWKCTFIKMRGSHSFTHLIYILCCKAQ